MTIALQPSPGAASRTQVIRSQATLEWRLMMSNGEQVLLTLVIPIVLLLGLGLTHVVSLGAQTQEERLGLLVPGVVALAIMSSAFTALAIATGFDRRGEAIKFLGTTPLTRTGLLAAKVLAVLGIQAVQLVVILGVALAIGWRPAGSAPIALLFLLLGTWAFAALGLALAGVLRAEATLAAANAIYLLLLVAGGVIIPTGEMPQPWSAVIGLLPSAALANGLREAMTGTDLGGLPLAAGVLVVWALIGSFCVHRWFRWTS
jgi:ABC-2 type transport system permease protein